METIIEAKGIEKSFGKLKVLKGVGLTVAKSEVLAIMGASGAACPVLLCTIFQGDTEYNGQTYKSNIGYFVLEAFDDMAFSEVKQAIDFLAENQIDDLILDLRFSPGGSVALCRYLMTAIVGPSHYNDVFAKMKFADGTVETWTYGGGSDKNGPDGFGTAADLGLDRLFVICSENTASAAEIVINSLKAPL